MIGDLSLYIHWPFCLSKCPYCDFNSHVREKIDEAQMCAALLRELDHYSSLLSGRRLTSIFFGGGTPSLMAPETVAALIDRATKHWSPAGDIEITLEANPTSVEAEKFYGFRSAGVNRVSLGVQALNDADLKFLGRGHDTQQARAAVALAAKIFPRYSFDLIYARHGQTTAAWKDELRDALTMTGDHLSLYQLTIEPNTQFYTRAGRGEALTAPDPVAVELYELTQTMMTAAGLPAYEISNHARTGRASRHNLAYWHYDDYVGIGAGAHGRITLPDARYATEAHRAPEVWLEHVEQHGHGLRIKDPIDLTTAKREAVLMGLRLAGGIDRVAWQQKFGSDIVGFLATEKLARLQQENLLILDTARLRATPVGLQKLNSVLNYLLAAT
jgi:putative oxygen-independent coproporphyrinogen III oxidase